MKNKNEKRVITAISNKICPKGHKFLLTLNDKKANKFGHKGKQPEVWMVLTPMIESKEVRS